MKSVALQSFRAISSKKRPTLQNFALKLENGGWCRHWYNWGGHQDSWVMAIQVRNWVGAPIGIGGIEEVGFVWHDDLLYLIKLCNDDGTPYKCGQKNIPTVQG